MKFTLPSFLVAMVVALAGMPTNVFQICTRNVGTLPVDPWLLTAAAFTRKVAADLRNWFAALFSRRAAFACAAVLLALLVAHLASAHPLHHGVIFAALPTIAGLKGDKEKLLRDIEALKNLDGSFKSDEARAAFDAKMTEVESIDAQVRKLEKDGEQSTDAQIEAARQEGIAAERGRIAEIRKVVRAAKLEDSVADGYIARALTIEQVRKEVLDTLAARSEEQLPANAARGGVTFGEDAKDKFLRGVENWLLVKGGVAKQVAQHRKIEVATMDPGEFRGLSLMDLARLCLERAGRNVRGFDKMRVVSEAFTIRGGSGALSTSDFTTLLENVMHKTLQAAYAITPDTWSKFCETGTVSDFRAQNRYRLGSFGSLDALTEQGEFKYKSLSDAEKATITASTKGNIIGVSRQMIVNDDMNAFSKLPMMLGRAAKLSVEVDVYALLAQNANLGPTMGDGLALFDAGHSNISTGAALAAAALDADRVKMAQQKDKDGNDFLDLRPAILLVPVSLGGQAKVINLSQYDPDTVANKSQMKPNIVAGLFREIVDSPRLSGTRRYLFADPAIAPVLEVAFLEGQQEPVLESEYGWKTDGAELRARLDYGVAATDFRGAITNAGT